MWQYRRVGGELPDVMPPVLKAADSNWPTAVAVVQRQCVNVLLDTAAVSYRDCDISITDSSQATLCPCTYSLLHTGALRTISNTRLKDDVTTYRRATAMGDESTRCPGTRVVLCRQSSTESCGTGLWSNHGSDAYCAVRLDPLNCQPIGQSLTIDSLGLYIPNPDSAMSGQRAQRRRNAAGSITEV